MDRNIPVASRLCFEQSFERSYLIHQHKMATYKPMIDNKPPPQVEFLRRRFEDVIKKAKVERDNRVLVNKIQSIFEHGHHLSLKKDIDKHAQRFTSPRAGRHIDYYELNKENQSMLNRLNSQTSSYNHRKFFKEREQVEKNISLISTFRVRKDSKRKTRMAGWFVDLMQGKKKSKAIANSEREHSREILFNRCQEIAGKYYYVEIVIRDEWFNINIENVENDLDKYQLKITKQEGLNLLSDNFEGSVQQLVDSIVIDAKGRQCYIECYKRDVIHVPQHDKQNKEKKAIIAQETAKIPQPREEVCPAEPVTLEHPPGEQQPQLAEPITATVTHSQL